MNAFENQIVNTRPINVHQFSGYEIRLMTDDAMGDFFGYALMGKIYIRENLPDKVYRFVVNHEKYHLMDTKKWLGWFGSEVRANIYCGLRDPIGLLFTIAASLNKRRLTKYWQLLTRANKV